MASRVNHRMGHTKSTKPKELQGSKKNTLTDRQILFVDRYINNNCNLTEAAAYADVGVNTACKWLNSEDYPAIQHYMESQFEKRRNVQEVKGDRIIQELARIAFINQKRLIDKNGHPIPLQDLPDDVAAAISSINISYREDLDEQGNFHRVKDVKYRLHDKLTALLQLGKMLGLDNGNALTVLNQTNINNIVINWSELYRQAPEGVRAALENDPIEARINAEAFGRASGFTPLPASVNSGFPTRPALEEEPLLPPQGKPAPKKLKVVDNND